MTGSGGGIYNSACWSLHCYFNHWSEHRSLIFAEQGPVWVSIAELRWNWLKLIIIFKDLLTCCKNKVTDHRKRKICRGEDGKTGRNRDRNIFACWFTLYNNSQCLARNSTSVIHMSARDCRIYVMLCGPPRCISRELGRSETAGTKAGMQTWDTGNTSGWPNAPHHPQCTRVYTQVSLKIDKCQQIPRYNTAILDRFCWVGRCLVGTIES